jgi:hypothetical protein
MQRYAMLINMNSDSADPNLQENEKSLQNEFEIPKTSIQNTSLK